MHRVVSSFARVFIFLAAASTVHALTVVPRTFGELVARADTVFRGTVVAKDSLWVGDGKTRHIATRVTFLVGETYKGTAAAQQTLEFVGGTVGGTTLEIPGVPRFEVGQDAVLFVVGNGKQFCPLVGIQQGRFHVVKDAATGNEHVFTDDGLPVARTAELGRFDESGVSRVKLAADGSANGLTIDDFRAEILRQATSP